MITEFNSNALRKTTNTRVIYKTTTEERIQSCSKNNCGSFDRPVTLFLAVVQDICKCGLKMKKLQLRLLQTFRGQEKRFFFYLTKFNSVILSSAYKRKISKISNKVNKLGRRHYSTSARWI